MSRIYEKLLRIYAAEGDNAGVHHLSELAKKYPYRAEMVSWAANLKALKFTVAPAKI